MGSDLFDPTNQKNLIALRDRAQNHLSEFGVTETKPAPSTALILSGGGGKGAYEAGCMLALWDCGLRKFKAIAGTSVGGLNAALFKRLHLESDRNVVLRVWSDLRVSRILKGNLWTLVKVLLYFPVNILALQRFPKPNQHMGNLEIEMERPWDWVVQFIKNFLSFYVPVIMGVVALVFFALGFGYLFSVFGIDKSNFSLAAFGPLTLVLIPMLCRWASRRIGITSNAPLRKTVRKVYDKKLLKGDPEVIISLATVPPNAYESTHAHYLTFAKITNEDEAIQLLVQTAALPEIFPMRKIHGHDYVDGGVEDNTPILGVYPIQPTRVIVIYLDDRYNLMLERRKKANYGVKFNDDEIVWDRDIALKLWESSRLEVIAQRRGQTWEGPLRDWFWGLELVPVIPSRCLGNFITGTMNFSQRKARDLMALGYKDMLNVLLAWQPRESQA
ncbi:MAG: patatin-like phospholipase family protein [Proteobacteria bacterium]|nr:patatin-like phospholipase family protein [Pseudomonadota bacterium]